LSHFTDMSSKICRLWFGIVYAIICYFATGNQLTLRKSTR